MKKTTRKVILMVTTVSVLFLTLAVSCPPSLFVTYNGNGNTGGTAPIDTNLYEPGATVTVAAVGSLVRAGHEFAGWNAAADGSGTSYAAGSTFTMGAVDVTLYAQWTPLSAIVGSWAINDTVAYYYDTPPVTLNNTMVQTNVYNSDLTFSSAGTSQWEGMPAQTVEMTGTYVYDAAAETLDLTYETFMMDGAPQTVPGPATWDCVIADTTMTLTAQAVAPYTPAEPLIYTRQ